MSYNNGRSGCARGISGKDDNQGLRDDFRMPMRDIESSHFRSFGEWSFRGSFVLASDVNIYSFRLFAFSYFVRANRKADRIMYFL